MRGALRTLTIMAAAFGAAVALFVGFTLPPRHVDLAGPRPSGSLYGAFHVHTARSDGTGSVADVAAAAARARLDFVILTDHGDATRPPLPPAYIDDVLIVDAVEVSTFDGHLVALRLDEAAPYPLAGRARDVVEDVHRLGGLVVLSHPDSPRGELQWRGRGVAYDGFEWLNADSQWRDDPPRRLLAAALRGLVRGPESVVSLFTREQRAFARWDGGPGAGSERRPFGVAALDAHARIGWDAEGAEPPRRWTFFARPSYELMFRSLAQVVLLDDSPSGDAAEDAARLLEAFASGRTYSITRAIAGPAVLEFSALQGGAAVRMGERLLPGPASFRAAVPGVPNARVRLIRNGAVVAQADGEVTSDQVVTPDSVFRVEVDLGDHPFPWIVSNPIFAMTGAEAVAEMPLAVATAPERLQLLEDHEAWRIERDTSSTGTVTAHEEPGTVQWHFELGSGVPSGQFVALSVPVEGDAGYESVQFDVRASRPMRLSFQVRLPGSPEGQRWGTSVYLDQQERRVVVRLEDLEPIGRTSSLRPVVARIRSLLFVMDTVNTAPGSAGDVWLRQVSLGLGPAGQQ